MSDVMSTMEEIGKNTGRESLVHSRSSEKFSKILGELISTEKLVFAFLTSML